MSSLSEISYHIGGDISSRVILIPGSLPSGRPPLSGYKLGALDKVGFGGFGGWMAMSCSPLICYAERRRAAHRNPTSNTTRTSPIQCTQLYPAKGGRPERKGGRGKEKTREHPWLCEEGPPFTPEERLYTSHVHREKDLESLSTTESRHYFRYMQCGLSWKPGFHCPALV